MSKKCILAYTALYVDPDGNVRPCCVAAPFKDTLNWNDYETIPELYNAPQMRELRKSMEEGNPLSVCDICFKGGNPLMPYWNKRWESKLNDPNLIDSDYNIKSLHYLDARFSNLCNLKCRMCGPGLSSSWYEDAIALDGEAAEYAIKTIEIQKPKDNPVSKFTDEDIVNIEYMNVGGGEPFITKDFYTLLSRFTDEHASKISMYINSNLSTFSYKGINVLNELARFKEVVIGCSCDGYGKVGEYQRTGFNSDRFFNNLNNLIQFSKEHTNIIPSIEYTITSMNLFHIFDFIDYVTANTELNEYNIHFHWASTPYFFAPATAPDSLKARFISYIEENLKTRDTSSTSSQSLLQFLQHMKLEKTDIENLSEYRRNVKHFIETLDKQRGDSYKDVCPWLDEIIYHEMNKI